MKNNKKISVVIPCYKVSEHIEKVIQDIPEFVDAIIVVDDACPQHSGKIVEKLKNPKVHTLYHSHNQGVGGAVITGYKKSLALGSDITIKIDGDGQMNADYIIPLIKPLINNSADYTKGNRFHNLYALKNMPRIRLFGNSVLSFMAKFASGYWNILDATNGFTVITSNILNRLDLNKIDKRYFFEIDMLINLNLNNCVVKDVAMPAKYEGQKSSLNIIKIAMEFPPKIIKGLMKRIFYKYFIYDFNMATIYLLLGLPMFLLGTFFGLYRLILAIYEQAENTAGIIMLAALPIILGVQFLLQAISIDIDNIPKKKHTL